MAEPEVVIPPKRINTDYPIIDTDPHIRRVFGYARPRDYAIGGAFLLGLPATIIVMEATSPTYVGRAGLLSGLRLAIGGGAIAAFAWIFETSSLRFYGWKENNREVEMDMREMVDKVKRGEPLYGHSQLTPYMQGVAARNSRYSAVFSHILVWPNFVNHPYHGVDTAKYYQQAERELEEERLQKEGQEVGSITEAVREKAKSAFRQQESQLRRTT